MHLWQKHLLRIISWIYTIPLDLHDFAGSYTKTSNNLVNSSGRPPTMNFEQNQGCYFIFSKLIALQYSVTHKKDHWHHYSMQLGCSQHT